MIKVTISAEGLSDEAMENLNWIAASFGGHCWFNGSWICISDTELTPLICQTATEDWIKSPETGFDPADQESLIADVELKGWWNGHDMREMAFPWSEKKEPKPS